MVKIAHISDIHLRGIARHEEYTRAFKLLFKELKEDVKPDLIINTGDLWHTKTVNITAESIEKLSWFFDELTKIAPMINILGNHDCFTGDHELLTKNGWVTFPEIVASKNNEVATFNSHTKEIEFQLPTNWIEKDVNDSLLHLEGKDIDALVTKSHEFLYTFGSEKYKNKYIKTTAELLPKHACIPLNGIVNDYVYDPYAALLGFTFADGSLVGKKHGNSCRIQFKFKKERKIQYLKTLLDSLEYQTNFRKQKDGSTVTCIYSDLAKKIYNFFDGKKELKYNIFVNNLSFLKSFLTGYLNGDGCNRISDFYTFTSISKQSTEILVTIARLVGGKSKQNKEIVFGNYKNSKQQYYGNCNINDIVNNTTIISKIEIPYIGKVYCTTVDNGNLLVRRNGKIYIAGNCNLTNKDRLDVISPIHNALKNQNSFLYKKSGSYDHIFNNKKITFHVLSLLDKENWDLIKPNPKADINIALYHGSVSGCKTDSNFILTHGDIELDTLKQFDFALLGDIHVYQSLAQRPDKDNILKSFINYPGSLIQQNYGEVIKKGYCVWDIRDKDDWDVEWKKLVNLAPFVTLPWVGSVDQTLKDFENLHGSYSYLPDTRYRIVSEVLIPQVQTKQFIDLLKKQHKAAEVVFKTDLIANMDSINAHGMEINKKSLTQDHNTLTRLYEKYIEANKDLFRITKEEVEEDALDAAEIIKSYCQKLYAAEKDNTEARNIQWSIKEFNFDNIFGYGEGNTVNFENLHNIVGLLGNNRMGKSSFIGALMYVLFNTTDRGSVKNSQVINFNKDYCFGSVRINVAGEEYLIERKTTRTPSKKASDEDKAVTSLNLWLIETRNGQEIKVSKNGITRDDTDKNIRNLIGNSDDFLLTAFASQNNINRFIENKATKRKEILNRFLELDIFEKLFSYAKNDYQNLDNQSQNYSAKDWAKILERTEKEIEKLKTDISSTDERIVFCNEKRDQLNLWIKSHENTAKSIDTASVTSFESQIKAFNNQLTIIEDRIKNNKSKLKEKQKNKTEIEKLLLDIDIKVLEKELESFESLKDNFNKIQKEYDKNVSVLNTQEKAIVKLTMVPCGDQFPDCHYIKDAHKAKETIEIQKSLVKELSNNLNNCKSMLDVYVSKKLREQISNHHDREVSVMMLTSEIERLEDKIEHDNKNSDSTKREIKELETKLKALKKSIDLVEGEEFSKKKQQMDNVVAELVSLNSKKNECLISLGGKQDFLTTTMSEQTQGKDLIRKLKLYDSIQSAFSKNGIPAMVLKSQLPAINTEMAKVLDGLIDFSVTLETDTSSNVMDVFLEDSNCRRPIELCSGMEKTVCSLALRVALGNLSSLPRPDVFILDESFSALDEEQLQKGMELLSLFRGYFKSVLVISHQAQIKEVSDMIIEIKNNGKWSSINQA